MTPQQMESVMGPLQGDLVADNPNTPGTSPISAPATAAGNAASAVGTAASTAVTAAQQGWNAITPGLQSLDSAVQDAASTAGQAVGGAASAVGTHGAERCSGRAAGGQRRGPDHHRPGYERRAGRRWRYRYGADPACSRLPIPLVVVCQTSQARSRPTPCQVAPSSPLGKIAQGQQVSAPGARSRLRGRPRSVTSSHDGEQRRVSIRCGNLLGGNIIGPTVEQLTDPATWVGVGGVKSAIGVAASVAASVAAQQVAQNVIPDDDPNKGVKVALVSLLGAFHWRARG